MDEPGQSLLNDIPYRRQDKCYDERHNDRPIYFFHGKEEQCGQDRQDNAQPEFRFFIVNHPTSLP